MKNIALSQSKVAIVDDGDFEAVSKFKWYCQKANSNRYYAKRSTDNLYLHRFILNPPTHQEIDHINGDSLDCRRSNMRICSHAENMFNKRIYKNNTSGFKGVCPEKGLWCVQLKKGGQRVFRKYFKDLLDASQAYQRVAFFYHGRFARIK